MQTFVWEPGRTADPSTALGMTKGRVTLPLAAGPPDPEELISYGLRFHVVRSRKGANAPSRVPRIGYAHAGVRSGKLSRRPAGCCGRPLATWPNLPSPLPLLLLALSRRHRH